MVEAVNPESKLSFDLPSPPTHTYTQWAVMCAWDLHTKYMGKRSLKFLLVLVHSKWTQYKNGFNKEGAFLPDSSLKLNARINWLCPLTALWEWFREVSLGVQAASRFSWPWEKKMGYLGMSGRLSKWRHLLPSLMTRAWSLQPSLCGREEKKKTQLTPKSCL